MGFKSGFVSIIGRPNVGKSTLLNQILQDKVAITTPKAQTTRNLIRGIYHDDERQIVFVDTPGIHESKDLFGREMVREAISSLNDVDLVYFLIDGRKGITKEDQKIIDMVHSHDVPMILVVNKIDTLKKSELIEKLMNIHGDQFQEIVPISALERDNIEELLHVTDQYLPNEEPIYPDDQYVDYSEKFMVGELIREKVMLLTENEIPHRIAVTIEKMEFESKVVHIYGVIWVDKDSQKGIIIGKEGSKLKEIGTLARHDIERLLQKKVYLQLFVRVEKDWRNRLKSIRELGVGGSTLSDE